MLSYYTSIILMSLIALGVLALLIRDNNRLSFEDKRLLYITCGLIAVSALAEWCGVQMDGRMDIPAWALLVIITDLSILPTCWSAWRSSS